MQAILQHLVEFVCASTKRVIKHDSLKVEPRIHAELLRMGRERGIENNQAVIDLAPTQEWPARGSIRSGKYPHRRRAAHRSGATSDLARLRAPRPVLV